LALPLHEFSWHLLFFENVEKIQVSLKSDTNNGYFTWRHYVLFLVSHQILLRMRNVSGNSYSENQDPHFMSSSYLKIVPFVR
jgi:hypothetical protein